MLALRALAKIEADFRTTVKINEPQRTHRLVSLMDELEQDYGAFIYNPTATDMERLDVRLYREISLARNL